MDNTRKKNWFEGLNEIHTSIPKIEKSIDNIGQFFLSVVELIPGMTNVKLIEQGNSFVTIQTNEGIMKRTNILREIINDIIIIEFDENYQADKTITTNSHFLHEFKAEGNIIKHSLIISALKAPGFMGFFYRNFGSKNIGNAFLDAHKQYLEK